MTEGRFVFHGIGQGLFYSGKIQNNTNSFNFVYDCGTFYKKDQPLLTSEITSCFCRPNKEKATINALFISHLHRDHISGLPELFKNYNVENVFIPYFSPEELLLICIANDMFLEAKWLSLFVNPAEYFAERGVKNVYLIMPSLPNGDIPKTDYDKFEQNRERYFESGIELNGEFESISSINRTNICKARNISLSGYNTKWIFKIYQDQTEEQQEQIRKEIIKACEYDPNKHNVKDLENLLSKKDIVEKAKKIYDKVKYGINQSSLVLYHSPLTNEKNCVSARYTQKCCHCCLYCNDPHSSPATLLTGDINLNHLADNGDRFEDFLYECPECIGFFQIPHHGSYKNLSLNIIKKLFPHYMDKICSYGKHNHFRHPDAYTLDELMQNSCGEIHHVVQKQSFKYDIVANNRP